MTIRNDQWRRLLKICRFIVIKWNYFKLKRLRYQSDVIFEIKNKCLIQKDYLNIKTVFIFLKIQHYEKSLLINIITILSRITLTLRRRISYLLANIIKMKT